MDTFLRKIDSFQQNHRAFGFVYAVVKKYGDDEAGQLAALMTYYTFLSLFPLLLVMTTLTQYIPVSHNELQGNIVKGLTNYFPVLGGELSAHVNTLQKNGLALIVGLLFTFYGARGVADAFRNSVQRLWGTPKDQQDGFPKSTLKSLAIIIIAGIGFMIASISIGFAAAAGHGAVLRGLTMLINLIVWYAVLRLLISISLTRSVPLSETRTAALAAAIGLVILQTAGGYLLKHELRNLDALYSYFAVALGLLFWIYLQVQVLFYALEAAAVRSHKLWPRSLSGKQLTAADKNLRRRK